MASTSAKPSKLVYGLAFSLGLHGLFFLSFYNSSEGLKNSSAGNLEITVVHSVKKKKTKSVKTLPKKKIVEEIVIPKKIVQKGQTPSSNEASPKVIGQGEAVLLTEISPPYPEMSIRLEEEGAVGLIAKIDSKGSVLEASITKSSGYGRLDEAALFALKAARFSESSSAGLREEPITIRFRLTDTY